MAVAAYRDRASGRYPISLAEVRASVNMLFGAEPSIEVLDEANVDPVHAVDPPVYDLQRQSLEELEPEKLGGDWRQIWAVIDTTPQLEPVPEEVTMRQARLALLGAGILDEAEAAIASLAGGDGRAAQIEWEYAAVLRRDHPLVAALGQSLGLDDEAKDALFRTAVTL